MSNRSGGRHQQQIVVVDRRQLAALQPKKSSYADRFHVSRALVSEEVGFPVSAGTVVDSEYERKTLGALVAIMTRWQRKWIKNGTLIPLEEARRYFHGDKKLCGHLRNLAERKFASVITGKVRIFVPIHPDDPVKPLVKAVFEDVGLLFTEEQWTKMSKGIELVCCWVGQPPQKRASPFAKLIGGGKGDKSET